MSDITNISINGATKTAKGTPIVKKTGELDKNSFLRILVAELSNQDPTQQKDSTQYIAQLAQFSSLEQLTNLNNNISFSGATSLIGKDVLINQTDNEGNAIMGTVKGVSKNGDSLTVTLQLMQNGKPVLTSDGKPYLQDFDYKNVVEVAEITKATIPNSNTTV
ncbi:MAG: flagellar hook capping protein [Clostridiaceae bacterium]|nr:flagellar hook capping protein [Clostridiaceae bacterium]